MLEEQYFSNIYAQHLDKFSVGLKASPLFSVGHTLYCSAITSLYHRPSAPGSLPKSSSVTEGEATDTARMLCGQGTRDAGEDPPMHGALVLWTSHSSTPASARGHLPA